MSEIIFIGTASGIPVPDRSHASFVIRADNRSYLFDAGDGCCSSLRRNRINLDHIGAIFISHMHPDHCAGLPMILQMMYLDGRTAPLDIYLPGEGMKGLTSWLVSTYLFPEKLPFHLMLSPIADGPFHEDKVITVISYKNRHLHGYRELTATAYPHNAMESYSFAIAMQGRRLVYSGDIASLNDLQAAVRDTDLLIVEATHVNIEETALFAASNNLGKVIFTHVPPTLKTKDPVIDGLKLKYGLETLALACDGLTIPI